jgi:hypothetical protein
MHLYSKIILLVVAISSHLCGKSWSFTTIIAPLWHTRSTLNSFVDFSAPGEWETFYQESSQGVLEWHSSVPLDRIASYVPRQPPQDDADILIIGCGNSQLPRTIRSNFPKAKIVLLDSSPTCLDQLMQLYGSDMEYVCANAVQLERLFPHRKFDIIIDKGLSDAIFCSEGWNGPLEELYSGAASILRPGIGRYLLVSYRLPTATKEFLDDVGQKGGLTWEFDIEKDSNDRVGVSLATKR